MTVGRNRWQTDTVDSSEEDSWLVTYLDVITLLLVMFVVMLAFSGGPSDEPGGAAAPAAEPADSSGAVVGLLDAPASGDRPISLSQNLDTGMLGDGIEISEQAGQLSFRISNDILFPSGAGMLTPAGFDQLEKLVDVLAQTDYQVTVFGHTDSIPISTQQFPSNWELSSARAASVVRYFIRKGLPDGRFSAVGLASTRPLEDNSTPEGRAQNRRVVITLHREGETPNSDLLTVPR
jgi:chemotaxis protein MotB